ncbi:MAG: His/Gly/Thr/Pro-type tRNA ligase C-terminal domain-containing protein [Candidatus Pacebacteria bacterium]|nr:His/Gly/Thr/Pro-type tRNA ligase C-terminal domain-containing protein [Candidatus Paceibacterota bacterium]
MKASKFYFKTRKEVSQDEAAISAVLLTKANFIEKLTSGVYNFLPLGLRVIRKIEQIIREEMEAIGGQEILMALLNPRKNWEQTGRWDTFNALFKVQSKYGSWFALAPTHEEVITPMVKNFIHSYKDLPLYLFHISDKFRDEPRSKSGILRGREFIMKDLYSFHQDEKDLEKYYNRVKKAYQRIFRRCGLNALVVESSGGTFSRFSHEFQVVTPAGEDLFYHCRSCNLYRNKEIIKNTKKCPQCGGPLKELRGSEVGNIFKLKDKYSQSFDLKFRDKNGESKNVMMGCYGIGISRLLGVIVEANHDANGIIWPPEVAPFEYHLMGLLKGAKKEDEAIKRQVESLYEKMLKRGIEVFYDDRENVSSGEKLVEADLLGLPYRIIISEKSLKNHSFELKERKSQKVKMIKLKDFDKIIKGR